MNKFTHFLQCYSGLKLLDSCFKIKVIKLLFFLHSMLSTKYSLCQREILWLLNPNPWWEIFAFVGGTTGSSHVTFITCHLNSGSLCHGNFKRKSGCFICSLNTSVDNYHLKQSISFLILPRYLSSCFSATRPELRQWRPVFWLSSCSGQRESERRQTFLETADLQIPDELIADCLLTRRRTRAALQQNRLMLLVCIHIFPTTSN